MKKTDIFLKKVEKNSGWEMLWFWAFVFEWICGGKLQFGW